MPRNNTQLLPSNLKRDRGYEEIDNHHISGEKKTCQVGQILSDLTKKLQLGQSEILNDRLIEAAAGK